MHWENILDWIGIGLCLAVAAYLTYSRIRCGRMIPGTRLGAAANDFRAEVGIRMLRQQALEALSAAADKIREEQQRLQQWGEKAPGGSLRPEAPEAAAAGSRPGEYSSLQSRPRAVHAAILDRLQRGDEDGEIADRLGCPRAEVALCRKLSRPQ